MATYVFKCKLCPLRAETDDRESVITCQRGHEPTEMVRDYRAENVGAAIANLKVERESGGREDYKNLFLPKNSDFAGPGDPDGTKGMRAWRDEHQPKAGNKRPDWPGTVEKKVW